jgi:hypothetical protein
VYDRMKSSDSGQPPALWKSDDFGRVGMIGFIRE